MNVLIFGGTGLLGSAAAQIFVDRGHSVKTVASPHIPKGVRLPEEMQIIYGNFLQMSDVELEHLMSEADVFVFAAGVDERAEFPPPVYDAYKKYNIDPVDRYLSFAKKCGVQRCVILGSYFAWLAKKQPQMQLQLKHPYIKSRLEQENVAFKYADENMAVAVLELPYIFGVQPGRKPVWTILAEQLKRFEKMPFTLYPRGGTAMITVRQAGEAIVGAAETVKGARSYGISCYNMTWRRMLKIVYSALYGDSNRVILDCPTSAFKLFGMTMRKQYAEKGIEPGIDPVGLADIMDKRLFIPTDEAKELGCTPDEIEKAIFDSMTLAKDSIEGKVDLISMTPKG